MGAEEVSDQSFQYVYGKWKGQRAADTSYTDVQDGLLDPLVYMGQQFSKDPKINVTPSAYGSIFEVPVAVCFFTVLRNCLMKQAP